MKKLAGIFILFIALLIGLRQYTLYKSNQVRLIRVSNCLAKCDKWPDCGFNPDQCWLLP